MAEVYLNDSKRGPCGSRGSQRQRVLDFIKEYTAAHTYPPSVREIAAGVGIGPTTAHYHIKALRGLGYLSQDPHRARSLRVNDEPVAETK